MIVVRLEGIADRLRNESDAVARLVQAPCQVHVLRQGARAPPSDASEDPGAVRREAARGDQRLFVEVLYRLVERERREGFDVAPPLEDRPGPAGDHPTTGR